MYRPQSYWDFSETRGYYTINGVKVLKINSKEDQRASDMLIKMQMVVKDLIKKVKKYHKYGKSEELDRGVLLLLTLHDRPFVIQEINHPLFIGLNKPKNVKGGYAQRRSIFLTVRGMSQKDVTDLLVHELAHTMANHVIFIDDNHGKDFQMFENYLQTLRKKP